MTDNMKPCPFCGGEASKIPDANHSTGWEVGCFSGKCDVEPHIWAVHLETAVMQWNTRADRIEELVKDQKQGEAANPVIKELLRDDRFESKDWKHADTAGRIEWLIAMLESKIEEVTMWVDLINGEAN